MESKERRNKGGIKREGKKREKKKVIQNHGQDFELLGQLILIYSVSL